MIVLLFFSAVISASEVAYFSLSHTDRIILENENTNTSHRILRLLRMPEQLLATILVANNFVNISIVILSTYIIAGVVDFTGYPAWMPFTIQVLAVTFIILLLGEVVPKVYATTSGLKICRAMSLPLTVIEKIFKPVSFLLVSSTNLINKHIRKRGTGYSSDHLEHALELTRDHETSPGEERILKGIVRFGSTDAKQIMTPRTEVSAFEIDTPFSELLGELLEQGYSRVPVFSESIDKVKGILYLKDLLPYADHQNFEWQSLLRKAFFVPENKKLDDLLKEFQSKKIHMAVVVDEYGGTSGIITLEDVIEEIVGDIADDFDDEEIFYSRLDDRTYVFEGKTPLVDIYKVLDINGDDFEEAKGESDTLAGFIIELTGKIPSKNEKVKFDNYIFTIEAADKRKVKRVKLTIQDLVESEGNK
jgi:gliding motility-associated protein GldE